MELTTAQKNELATRLVNAQQTGNYQGFNDLVRQLRLTQADLLQNFPAINQSGINEQIGRGAVVPTSRPAATTYSTAQVANAIRDSLKAGFTVQQARMGAMTNFGLSSEEFDRALSEVQVGRNTFSDERVAQAIRDSLAQGFTMDQARQGALANYGVGADQFNRAMQMVQARPETFRGSAPTFQFPGLLSGREDMPTGARRFLSQAPGSLLFDVPRVEGGEFTFTPGEFNLQQLQEQVNANRGMTPGSTEGLDIPSNYFARPATKPSDTTQAPSAAVTQPPAVSTAASKYSDAQVAQAIQESMNQGFSLVDSMAGATRVFDVPVDQVYRAATNLLTAQQAPGLLSTTQTTSPATSSPSAVTQSIAPETTVMTQAVDNNVPAVVAPPSFTQQQIGQAIVDSINQGFTMDQIQRGAFNNFGVGADQFNQAAALLPGLGYNIGQGFSRL